MKTKSFLLLFVLFLTLVVNAQITTSPAGIAIQGIARDAQNRARANATLTLNFLIYYGTNTEIYSTNKQLITDPYGVFSTVIEPGTKSTLIANKDAYLKISDVTGGSNAAVLISDEKFKQVPYAIAASNGVPTGSIMPYIGTTAPAGWVLCDGQSLTTIDGAGALIALIGNNAPDLRGMFLRGGGTNATTGYTTYSGPALKNFQGEDVKPHTHITSSAGAHTHTSKYPNERHGLNGDPAHHNDRAFMKYGPINEDDQSQPERMRDLATTSDGAHTHTVTANSGTETRPVNYGVNYIIKL